MQKLFKSFSKIIETPFFVLEEAKSDSQNNTHPYYRITGNNSVIALILDEKDNFIMVKQYRQSLEQETLEIPAGSIENGEEPFQAIRREIAEETNYQCNLIPLGNHYRLMMNRTNIKEYLFFGMQPKELKNIKKEEGIKVIKIPREKLFEYAVTGEFQQIAAIAIFHLTSSVIGIDITKATYKLIEQKFLKKLESFNNE